ncbi:MAG: PKD domain-containing protein [Saprospiraceae bacterium]|nr:PKD domain-containing protein [Saprospiraceae bacterium]
MQKPLLFLFLFAFNLFITNAQTYTANPISKYKTELDKKFKKYEIFELNIENVFAGLNTRGTRTDINIVAGSHNWDLELFEHDMFAANYVRSIADDQGVKRSNVKPIRSYLGNIKGVRGGNVNFNISENIILASIEYAGTTYFIENLRGIAEGASSNEIIIYNTADVIENKSILCGFDAMKQVVKPDVDVNINRNHCVIVEIALACDFSVFQVRSSGSEAWASGILSLMAGNYDNEFAHLVEFDIAGTFVATTAPSDPWNGVNNINTHLNVHVSWGNGGGYGVGYDVATAWTRKYTSGAVGLAYVGVVCTSNRYNVCSDFGGSDNINRQLQAHEVGHNFSSGHDAGGSFIMAPSVNGSSTWSSQSINAINNHIASRGCLGSCGTIEPPVAFFRATPTTGCVPMSVTFTDLSTGVPTSWLWTFPGGTPSTSTQRNPTLTYNTVGSYDVTLRVTNAGGNDTETFFDYIVANDTPTCVWSEYADQKYVEFTDNSDRATSYAWKFGDGNTSNLKDPTHEYAKDGIYNVCLKTSNVCGFREVCKKITIVSEVFADFEVDNEDGCAPYIVTFKNKSSDNVNTYRWTFPGGDPSTSTLKEPTVRYNYKGKYDVTLFVSNTRYSDQKLALKYMKIDSLPFADFTYNSIGLDVDFSNLSVDGLTYAWTFGDGMNSVLKNPIHSYASAGQYSVRLITTNYCGTDTAIYNVTVSGGLAANYRVDKTNGCTPYTVTFENLSQNAKTYNWSFPGGNPSSSTDRNPTVTYQNPGSYDINLVVSDGIGTADLRKSSYITVENYPEAQYSHTIKRFDAIFTNESKYGTSYLWNFGDNSGTSTEQSPTHTYGAEGEYLVKLSVTNGCGTITYEKLVSVYLIPKVNFTSDYNIVCAGDTVNFKDLSSKDVISWDWVFDGANISATRTKDPIVIYEIPGVYGVKLTVSNTNGNNSLAVLKYIEVRSAIKCPEKSGDKRTGPQFKKGVVSKRDNADVGVIPNPASEKIQITGLSSGEEGVLEIFSINGLKVKTVKIGSENSSIDVSSLFPGVYFLKMNSNQSNFKHKLIIE